VAIIRSGRLVYEGSMDELKATQVGSHRLRTTDDERARRVCLAQPGIADVRAVAGGIAFAAGDDAVAALSVALVEAGAPPVEIARETATLEELFFRLTEGDQGDALPAAPVGDPA
jgi:ABC-2 type transport system ATP-binding protein